MRTLPTFVPRLKGHQISVSLSPAEAKALERIRMARGDRSWGETLRAGLKLLEAKHVR